MQRSLSRSSWGVFHSRRHIFAVGRERLGVSDQHKRAYGSSIPRLVGTFCGVDVAINDLEIWQAPKIEQLRPGHIPVFPPHSKQRTRRSSIAVCQFGRSAALAGAAEGRPRHSAHSRIATRSRRRNATPLSCLARHPTMRRGVPQIAPPCTLNVVSAPEVFERSSAQLRVSGRVLDVGMAQPQLQPSSIVAGIGQEVPASVAQHMRVQVG